VDEAAVDNIVIPAALGSVGAASVVFITAAAGPIFQDVKDDGILNR
jgi:hypothetical protein